MANSTSDSYNLTANQVVKMDGRGVVATVTSDALNRVVSKAYSAVRALRQ